MRRLVQMLVVMLALLALLVANEMAYDDELAERDLYCAKVRDGVWPDYRDIYETECAHVHR